ncbi:MAG: GDP-mannose mannosyl hydrolase [Gammaproteobacteria bacterium]|nr:GDP-mannose mannosyl hydrolase [Gammaproteobacteria bacterium]MCW8959146.1 GDP-mannose mannosyl hydrolase [Gammaproteobacteria bacterium]MCW8993299.1 GDP-mannose mannosyl hydrolase [Gammaproteobacteria bacterium]
MERSLFSAVVANTPLVSIDLVVRNPSGEVLLGLRTNRPAQGTWFVPGGRIRKDEAIRDAFMRLTEVELGRAIPQAEWQFLGVYEHFYPDNFSGDGFSTHYVVLGYEIRLDIDVASLPKEQHSDYRWWGVDEMLASDEVHLHSKWYLRG